MTPRMRGVAIIAAVLGWFAGVFFDSVATERRRQEERIKADAIAYEQGIAAGLRIAAIAEPYREGAR